MTQKRLIARVFILIIPVVASIACNFIQASPTATPTMVPTSTSTPTPTEEPVSANDLAVCDAYQQLIDAWPVDSAAVNAAGSAQDIYLAIEEAGAALVDAGKSADDPDLGQIGENVGNAAVRAIELNEEARQIGFVPFFDESWIGGEALSQLCLQIGKPISQP